MSPRGGAVVARTRQNVYRAALRHRDFRLLAVALLESAAGDYLYAVAIVVYVFDETGSPTWVAVASVLRALPMVLLTPLAGALVDRYDRLRVLVISDASRAVTMVVITVLTLVGGPVAVVVALAVLANILSTPYVAGSVALAPALVPEEDLAAANAVTASFDSMAVLVGPAVAGVLLAIGSPALAFAVNAATFAISTAVVRSIRTRPVPVAAAERGVGRGVLHGFRVLATSASLLMISIALIAICFTIGETNVLFVLVSSELLHTGSSGLGYLLAAMGVGGLVAAFLSDRVASSPRLGLTIAVGLTATGASIALIAPVTLTPGVYALVAVYGAVVFLLDVLSVTLLQRSLAAGLIGRAFGALDASAYAAIMLGALVAPALVSLLGLRATLVVSGVIPIAVALAAQGPLRRLDAAAGERLRRLEPRVALLGRLDVFAGAPRPVLESLAAAVVQQRVPAGTAVVRQGDPADDLFVVVEGRFDVTSSGEKGGPPAFVRSLTAPSYFGEIGLLARVPRTATVTAARDCRVLRLAGADFLQAVAGTPMMARSFDQGMRAQLRRTHPAMRVPAMETSD